MPDPLSPSSPLHLVVDGRIAAPVEVAGTRRTRARGLLGRTGVEGALLLPRTSSVHALGMRFPLDVALCTEDLEVVAVRELRPGGLVLPRRSVRTVLEAERGAFHRWGLGPGSRLAISGGADRGGGGADGGGGGARR